MRRLASSWRALRLLGLAVIGCGALVGACSSTSGATVVSGPVTVTAASPANAPTPWGSGQVVDITVAANSTLNLSNMENVGHFGGEPPMKAVECDDPGGSAANLPTTPSYHCDGSTILSTSLVNDDGSFHLDNYPVFALPDSISLGEPSGSLPKCGTQADQCVLYIGPDQLDFSKPHLFSAPFLVTTNSNDKPSAAGAAVRTTGGAGVSIAASSSAASASVGGGTLAFTGPLPATPGLIVAGIAMIGVGTLGRRRLRRGVPT
jgi:hypothetical protein